jgi:hypothetical protein
VKPKKLRFLKATDAGYAVPARWVAVNMPDEFSATIRRNGLYYDVVIEQKGRSKVTWVGGRTQKGARDYAQRMWDDYVQRQLKVLLGRTK